MHMGHFSYTPTTKSVFEGGFYQCHPFLSVKRRSIKTRQGTTKNIFRSPKNLRKILEIYIRTRDTQIKYTDLMKLSLKAFKNQFKLIKLKNIHKN